MKKERLSHLAECAVLAALSTVLALLPLIRLPYGGEVTVCAMLPAIAAGYRNGPRWGILCGAVCGVLRLFLLGGLSDLKGISAAAVIGSLVFDYLLAFGVLGLAGLYRHRLRPMPAFGLGTATVILLRYAAHFISGVVFFGEYAGWFFTEGAGASWGAAVLERFSGFGLICVYSVTYNGLYMIPELIVETAAAFALAPLLARLPERG